MQIILNHNPEDIAVESESISVTELLNLKRYSFKMLVVKINDTLVRKENYSTATIKNGDNVQVIHLISGG